jgi:hypothetical protein
MERWTEARYAGRDPRTDRRKGRALIDIPQDPVCHLTAEPRQVRSQRMSRTAITHRPRRRMCLSCVRELV